MRHAARLSIGAVAVVVAGAAFARIAHLDQELRQALHMRFDASPGDLRQLITIVRRNLAVAAVPLAGAYIVPHRPTWRRGFDAFLAVVASGSLLIGSAAVAAYGWRLLRFVAPYGPVELLGFATAAATYLRVRGRPGASLHASAAITASLLIAAAVCETRWAGVV